MTAEDLGSAAGDEAELLARARSGDSYAVEQLYALHAEPARRLALLLAGPSDADDLVSEAYARVLDAVRAGRGPTANFSGYLKVTIRNLHRDRMRGSRERPSSDIPWILDAEEPPAEQLVEGIDSNGAVRALSSLPEAWQQVLWMLEVEGLKTAEIAGRLDLSPAAVSSLTYRAREGLRRAFLDQQAATVPMDRGCSWTRHRLSGYVRGDLSLRARTKVEAHLAGCPSCPQVLDGMEQINKRFAAYVLPVVLLGGVDLLGAAGTPPVSGSPAARSVAQSSRLVQAVSAVAGAAAVVAVAAAAWSLTDTAADSPRGDRSNSARPTGPGGTPPPTASSPTSGPTPTEPSPTSDVDVEAPPEPSVPVTDPVADPDPEADPRPVVVHVQAPTVRAIISCGTWGSLELARTPGIRYRLVEGDGRQGPFVVTASATKGHVIARGSRTRFTGDLGTFEACPPAIGGVSKILQGTDPAQDPWGIEVVTQITDAAPHVLAVVYRFDSGVFVKSRQGAGWTCREPGGVEVGIGDEYYFPEPGTAFTCTFQYAGEPPPSVTFVVQGADENLQVVEPTGTVTLTSDGEATDERPLP